MDTDQEGQSSGIPIGIVCILLKSQCTFYGFKIEKPKIRRVEEVALHNCCVFFLIELN